MKRGETPVPLRTGRNKKKKTAIHKDKFADRKWWWQEDSVLMYLLYVESKVKPIKNSKMVVTGVRSWG